MWGRHNAYFFGDQVNGSYMGDLVDVHGSRRAQCGGPRPQLPVRRQQLVRVPSWMGRDAQKISQAPPVTSPSALQAAQKLTAFSVAQAQLVRQPDTQGSDTPL